MQFSPDGQWFWDGAGWHPAYSPDRRWRWDGTRWLPTGPPRIQRWRYEPTEWTRRLQVTLIALTLVGWVVGSEAVNAFVLPTTQRMVDAMLTTSPPDPNVDAASLQGTMMAAYMFGGLLSVVLVGITVAGIVRLWRWAYWYLAVSYLIAPLTSLQYALDAQGPISAPRWLLLLAAPLAVIQTAVAIWMIVLHRRYGTWARRRLPA